MFAVLHDFIIKCTFESDHLREKYGYKSEKEVEIYLEFVVDCGIDDFWIDSGDLSKSIHSLIDPSF